MTPREVRLPFWKFYPEEWLSDGDVLTLSDTGVRAFINLLCHQWRAGPLPTDSRTVEREVLALFTPHGNAYVYVKLEAERKNAEETHAKYVEAGRKGGKSSTASSTASSSASSQGQARLKPGSSQAEVFSDAEADAEKEAEVNPLPSPPFSPPPPTEKSRQKSDAPVGGENGQGKKNGNDLYGACIQAQKDGTINAEQYKSVSNAVHDLLSGQPSNVRRNRNRQLGIFPVPVFLNAVLQANRDLRHAVIKKAEYYRAVKRNCKAIHTEGVGK
jgi:hypothetical protein